MSTVVDYLEIDKVGVIKKVGLCSIPISKNKNVLLGKEKEGAMKSATMVIMET